MQVRALVAESTPQALGAAVAAQYTARANAEYLLSGVSLSLLEADAVRTFDVAMKAWATAARAALSGATAQALLLRLATARATAVEMVNAPGFDEGALIDLGALLRTLHHVCINPSVSRLFCGAPVSPIVEEDEEFYPTPGERGLNAPDGAEKVFGYASGEGV